MITPGRAAVFFAVLTLVANAVVVAALVLVLAARSSDGAKRVLSGVRSLLGRYGLLLAWAPPAVAMAGSLYFSEVAHYIPCTLCWYQRIGIYPFAIILAVAAWRRDLSVRWYFFPVAAVSIVISAYHYLIEWYPNLERGSCSPTLPCSLVWFREFGFITLPYMAASTLLLSGTLLLLIPARSES